MAVYVDDAIWRWAGRRWCHLLADDIDELHRFAAMIGVHRLLYQGPPKTSAPHYDLTGMERDRALRMGAVACGRDEIVAVFRRVKIANGKVARPGRIASASADEAPVLAVQRIKDSLDRIDDEPRGGGRLHAYPNAVQGR